MTRILRRAGGGGSLSRLAGVAVVADLVGVRSAYGSAFLFIAVWSAGCASASARMPESSLNVPTTVVSATVGESFAQRMHTAMTAMNQAVQAERMTGNADHDFAAMMIPHHQAAIDMAKAELLYGKDPVLRRLAEEVIVTQGSEIRVMQAQLDK